MVLVLLFLSPCIYIFRMSTYAPPTSKSVLEATSLPLIAHVTPFALPENEEMDMPLVDFSENFGDGTTPSEPPRYAQLTSAFCHTLSFHLHAYIGVL